MKHKGITKKAGFFESTTRKTTVYISSMRVPPSGEADEIIAEKGSFLELSVMNRPISEPL
ncbi:hypothetical protein [Gynuella sunshinyii]|uniref:Uncharacterized protein n=1 Tax=Gynuella sunshinyii YC6258 TaxID=1445510 RepID=A0A0C5VJ34_9GAMM|nr:hypothetical protein [Gynuella sunshinyii]AJQ94246.1 hypothetical Protein YC6258_02208 [Gynuella sunshinyii YC6258]